MKCNKCKKDVSEDSLFCEHCGHKIVKLKPVIKDDKLEDSNELKEKILEHLEFIGYEVKVTDPASKYLATHQFKSNLSFTIANGISFAAFYTVDAKKIEKNKDKALELINKMNNTAVLTSFSTPPDYSCLVCSSWFPCVYTKKTFAQFLDFFEGDVRRSFQIEGVMEVFS